MDCKHHNFNDNFFILQGTSYRTREEIQEVRQRRDPITHFREKMINAELATNDELKKIDQNIKKEIDEATKQAKSSPEIGLEELYADVHMQPLQERIRGTTPFTEHKHIRINQPFNI